ncbi:MAG: lipocalin-like domain-containing protein [Patescibacteria group bacterium]|jgi:predicted secreted hydrolase
MEKQKDKKNLLKCLFSGFIIIGVVVIIFGNNNFNRLKPNMDSASNEIDEQSKKDIYNVLWQKDISKWPEGLPQELDEKKLSSISPKTFGEEVFTMLQDVKTKTIPLVQRNPKGYDELSKLSENGFNTRAAYTLGGLMGPDYFNGYDGMKSINKLEFPRDYGMHENFQFGWNFMSLNLKDQNGNDIDVLINYFTRAIYPPDIAKKMGLSEIDNQVVEQIVGVGYSDRNLHFQAANPVISGKTGLVEFGSQPYEIKFGNNEVKSINKDSFLPYTVKIYDPETDLKIDLTFEQTKPMFLEGDEGKDPSMYNLGTWYYSIPNLKVSGTVNYAGDDRNVEGKGWFDNQWTAGVMPPGYPDNYYIRGLSNIATVAKNKVSPGWAWDWTEVQFDNNTEITLSKMHSPYAQDLKNHGETPPANTEAEATGKFIDTDGTATDISANVTINKWFKSPNSGAWYPDGWEVTVSEKNMTFTMTPTSPNQLFTTATGAEFREGGVKVTGKMGDTKLAGYGFGEGTAYSGLDYTFSKQFETLGVEDSPQNIALFSPSVPSIWLFVQSILLYLVSLILIAWLLIIIIHAISKKFHKRN